MSKTISFVARDELADWLESRAEEEMKSVSAVCQDIVVAEYKREQAEKPDKGGQMGCEADALEAEAVYEFATKREADAVRTQFEEYLGDDDARLKEVAFAEGTPAEVVEEVQRRADSEV